MRHRHETVPREQALREISESQVEATWEQYDHTQVSLALPHECRFGGVWYEDRQKLSQNYLFVPERLRQAGVATRLVSALTHIALTTGGFDHYVAGVSSPHTLKIYEKMFPGRMTYRLNPDPTDPLTIPAAEAIGHIDRTGQMVVAYVDLIGLSPADFEQPVNWQAPWHSTQAHQQ